MAKVFPIVKTDDDIPISSNLKLLGGNLNKSFLERDCGRCGEWVHYENEPHFISETTAVLRFAVFHILDYLTLSRITDDTEENRQETKESISGIGTIRINFIKDFKVEVLI